MSRKNEIKHTGRIIEIDQDYTTVEIIVSSACSACHAKTLCGMSRKDSLRHDGGEGEGDYGSYRSLRLS